MFPTISKFKQLEFIKAYFLMFILPVDGGRNNPREKQGLT
jgi:hypothetical protein